MTKYQDDATAEVTRACHESNGSTIHINPNAIDIVVTMLQSDSGSRGIVYGSYGPGATGHVFNGVNQGGVIRFIDGQTGKAEDMAKFKSLHLLRTS